MESRVYAGPALGVYRNGGAAPALQGPTPLGCAPEGDGVHLKGWGCTRATGADPIRMCT